MLNMRKKGLAIILVISILLTGITGCTKENKATENSNKAMGRYVETELKMPKDADKEVFFQLKKSEEGYPTLYSCNKDTNHKGVFQYTLQKNGEWIKSDIAWLKDTSVLIPYMSYFIFGVNGEQYFYTAEDIDGYLVAHLIKATGETTGTEIRLEGWDDTEASIYAPNGIELHKNGNIICAYHDYLNVYDKDTYKILSTITIDHAILSSVARMGDDYVFFRGSASNEPEGISIYNNNFNQIEEVPFEVPSVEGNCSMYVTDNNSIVMCNVNGIHLLSPKTKIWETIADGALTSLSLPSLYNLDIIQTPSNDYYILYAESSSDNFKLLKYSYDASVQTTPSIELSIYSLKNNSIVQEAANVFQLNHPDVKVTLRASMDEESSADKTDYIKAFNTELLSGNGSDLIVLDDLPADAYIAKGALTDLSKIIQPMLDSGELLHNIINNYKIDNKIYSVPTRYSIPIIYGNKKVVNASTSLDSIVAYVKSNPSTTLFGEFSYSDLVTEFLPIHIRSLCDEKGMLEKQALVNFLEKLKIISDATNCVSEYGENQRKPNYFSLASSIDVSLENTKSINDFCFPNSMINYTKGSFTSYENSFTPIGEIGINSTSKHKDLSLEFIQTLLSTRIQNQAFWDGGFPVNSISLEKWTNTIDTSYRAETEIENADGTFSPLIIHWPSADRIAEITSICKRVTNKAVKNDVLFNMVLEETNNFFDETVSVEDTADAIMKKAYIYLSE